MDGELKRKGVCGQGKRKSVHIRLFEHGWFLWERTGGDKLRALRNYPFDCTREDAFVCLIQ